MPILSRSLLADLGIHLSDEDYQSLADHFESTLEEEHHCEHLIPASEMLHIAVTIILANIVVELSSVQESG